MPSLNGQKKHYSQDRRPPRYWESVCLRSTLSSRTQNYRVLLCTSLINEFGKQKLESGIVVYSSWKQKVNAHPKSDFDSLKKWLSKANINYKGRVSSVKETGADEVTDEMLANLPF